MQNSYHTLLSHICCSSLSFSSIVPLHVDPIHALNHQNHSSTVQFWILFFTHTLVISFIVVVNIILHLNLSFTFILFIKPISSFVSFFHYTTYFHLIIRCSIPTLLNFEFIVFFFFNLFMFCFFQ